MKNKIRRWLQMMGIVFSLLTPVMANAAWWDYLISAVNSMDGDLQNKLSNVDSDLMNQLGDLDQDLQNVINQEINQLTGHSGYGTLNYDPHLMQWGQGADSWESVVNLYDSGNSNTGLAQTMSKMMGDFPVLSQPQTTFNLYTDSAEKNYDTLTSKTTLAARAASQLAFDKISLEQQVISTLNQQIENAPNAKAAADLNNRLSAENSTITLQLEKLMAVMVQQKAVTDQGDQVEMKASNDFYDMTGH